MGKSEYFFDRVYELATDLRIPLIDERVCDNVKISTNKTSTIIKFVFEEVESVIEGFLGLADFFHTVIIKQKDQFYISVDSTLYILESG